MKFYIVNGNASHKRVNAQHGWYMYYGNMYAQIACNPRAVWDNWTGLSHMGYKQCLYFSRRYTPADYVPRYVLRAEYKNALTPRKFHRV